MSQNQPPPGGTTTVTTTAATTVSAAVAQRFSARAFTAQQPDPDLVAGILRDAGQAASGGNLQPWRVHALRGQPLAELVAAVQLAPQDGEGDDRSYPPGLWEPYRSRRYKNGEDLYASLGIGRDAKPARLAQMAKNTTFFGAPVGVFVCVDARMGQAQWVDLGIYLQTAMLLATAHGLASCAQGFWRRQQTTLQALLGLPPEYMVAFGMALGYADPRAAINQWRADRAPAQDWLHLQGF